MRKIGNFILLITLIGEGLSQAPEIEWQNTIGGGSTDKLSCIDLTSDGGYILGGSSGSTIYGDKTEDNIGFFDYWIVKLDSIGDIEWQNTIGGTLEDVLTAITQTEDGGYIVGGYSLSGVSGDKTEANIGDNDYWIIKLNSIGNIVWQNTVGGNSSDQLTDLIQTNDGGFLASGTSWSGISGDKTEPNIGNQDYWIIKLNSEGNIEWQNTIGGTNADAQYGIMQTSDGNYLIGGISHSGISGDKTDPNFVNLVGLNTADYWVIKIDVAGNLLWQNTIGGNDGDYLYSLTLTEEGNNILGGSSYSNVSGNKTVGNYGDLDYWIVKTDSMGDLVSQWNFGGNSTDNFQQIKSTDDSGFILAGYSLSNISGNKSEPNYGEDDYWIIKIDSLGDIQWQKTFQGEGLDRAYTIVQTPDGGYIVGGQSSSNISPDKAENDIGNGDYWVIKLYPENCTPLLYFRDLDLDGFGNMGDSTLSCVMPLGYVANSLDCDDTNDLINPGMEDICNAADDNCNGLIDDDALFFVWYLDSDLDSFGDFFIDSISCFELSGFVLNNLDCNDSTAAINPDVSEICNGLDDNCNFAIDEDLVVNTFFADSDEDGFGNSEIFYLSCLTTISGYVLDSTDCDDSNSGINPISIEVCNGLDDNCDENIDEGLDFQNLYLDWDSDNFGNPLVDTTTCEFIILGYVIDSTDCDDANSLVYPGALEIFNNLDDNCNDIIDEGLTSINNVLPFPFKIFPNPSNGDFKIQFSSKINSLVRIEIRDIQGQSIYSETFFSIQTIFIKMQPITPGLYFLKIELSNPYIIPIQIIDF